VDWRDGIDFVAHAFAGASGLYRVTIAREFSSRRGSQKIADHRHDNLPGKQAKPIQVACSTSHRVTA
jgi:hypothetical protein